MTRTASRDFFAVGSNFRAEFRPCGVMPRKGRRTYTGRPLEQWSEAVNRIRFLGGFLAVSLSCTLGAPSALALNVQGAVTEYPAADGLVERCIRIDPFPGAAYSDKDREVESDYCALDLERLALCPKLWSTSPGTIVFELAQDDPASILAFERSNCAKGHQARAFAENKPATFKISVNGQKTSATYAPSSWVYYHLSRYFRTHTYVPPAVYRSMSLARHHERVVEPALVLVKGRHARMLAEGWAHLEALETGSLGGRAATEALTDEGRQVFGVLIDNKGDRYGPEVNGTRESGWGSGQNEDFQQTAPYLALRDSAPVPDAARAAIEQARRNPRMAKALAATTSAEQVYAWMQAVMEITLLDDLLRQQDRIGNIDYRWRWYWLEDGVLRDRPAPGDEPPKSLRDKTAWRLRQTAINDNDAGVRAGYANFAERTGMLEELAHYDPQLYRRLGALAVDLAARGDAWTWLRQTAGLSERETQGIADRAKAAFELLETQCRAGTLALDFDLAGLLLGEPAPAVTNCDLPAS